MGNGTARQTRSEAIRSRITSLVKRRSGVQDGGVDVTSYIMGFCTAAELATYAHVSREWYAAAATAAKARLRTVAPVSYGARPVAALCYADVVRRFRGAPVEYWRRVYKMSAAVRWARAVAADIHGVHQIVRAVLCTECVAVRKGADVIITRVDVGDGSAREWERLCWDTGAVAFLMAGGPRIVVTPAATQPRGIYLSAPPPLIAVPGFGTDPSADFRAWAAGTTAYGISDLLIWSRGGNRRAAATLEKILVDLKLKTL